MTPASGWIVAGDFYGWLPWLGGTVTARGEAFDLYATPVELVQSLDAPFVMVNFEARRGKVSFYADALYAQFVFSEEFVAEAKPIPCQSKN